MKKRRRLVAWVLVFVLLVTTVVMDVPGRLFAEETTEAVEEEQSVTDTESSESPAVLPEATEAASSEAISTEAISTEAATEQPTEATEAEPEVSEEAVDKASESTDTQEAVPSSTEEKKDTPPKEDKEKEDTPEAGGMEGPSRDRAERSEQEELEISRYEAASASGDEYKEDGVEITSVKMTINGVDWNQVDTVHNGDRLKISFDWKLDNTDLTTDKFVVDIGTIAENIGISDLAETTLLKGSTPIGIVQVKNGHIYLEITDINFLSNESDRSGGGIIDGEIDITGNPEQGDKVTIGIDGFTKDFTYDDGLPASAMGLWKSSKGGITYDNGNDKWYQTFEVSMQAWNGKVTGINMTDTLGDGLSKISDITVTESSVSGVNVNDTFANIAELNDTFSTMNANEKITFTYKVEVDEAVFQNENAKYTDSYKNTFEVNYRNNKNDTPTVSSSSGVSVNLPGVSKTGVLDVTNKKVTWTVTIDLRDYAKSGKSFNDFITSITDTPGDGLTGGTTLSEGDFTETSTGSGIYTATYETTVSDAKLDSPNAETLTNTVEITNDKGYKYSATGSVTTLGHNWTVKKENGSFNKADGTISWTVNVTGIPKGATDFQLVENLNSIWHAGNTANGKHKLQSVAVNGTTVVENGAVKAGNGIVTKCDKDETDWNRVYTLVFDNSFFASDGKDLTITYTTKVDETDYHSREYFWDNDAKVTFKHNNTQTTHSDKGYAKNSIPKQPLSKSGKPVAGEDQIAYTLNVNLDYLEGLQAGKTITIDDKLPENMKLVPDSVKASCFGTDWGNENALTVDGGVSVTASESDGKAAFRITVTEALLETQTKYHEQYGNPEKDNTPMVYVRLTYKTEVVNRGEFAKKGTTVFENEACISGGDPVSAEVSLSPQKAVTKAGEYPVDVEKTTTDSSGKEHKYTEKMAEYTIDVNPNSFELGRNGKFTAKDVLGKALNYDLTSVKVTDVDNNTVLAQGADYTFSYNYQENSLTFVLPDKKHLKISYYASCNLETGGKMDASNTTNTFQIMGQSSEAMKDNIFFNTVKVSSEFWAESGDATITLFKYWTDENNTLQALKGATFALYEAKYVEAENKITLEKAVGQPFTITADTGNIIIRNLAYDRIYALVETKAPEGFVKGETYYFVITGTSGVTLPESLGVRSFNSGEVLNYENEKKTVNSGSLKITKTIEGSVTREEAEGALRFEVRQTKDSSGAAKSKQIGEYTLKDFEYNVASQQWTLTLDDLEPGTYEVEETVYDIDGKVTKAVKYSTDGTTWSTGDKDTVAPVEVASDTTASLTYKDTYTAAPAAYISKRALGKSERLAGAELQVSKDGTVVAQWTTSAEEDKKFEIGTGASMLQADVEYTLTEISAPKGYMTAANPVKFKVDASGKVTINDKGSNFATPEGITLILFDKPLELKLRKVSDKTPAENLGGAEFELKQGTQLLTTVTSSSTGAVVMDTSMLQADGTTVYTLSETKAPASCEKLTQAIQFKVSPGGKIVLENPPQGVTLKDSDMTLQIVNKELVTVSGKKTWEDENNRDGMRPESIIVQLQQRKQGVAIWSDVPGKQDTLTDTHLEYTFSELPKRAKDGTEYEYRVIEKKDPNSTKGDLDDYEQRGGGKSDNYNLKNTYVAQRINVSVTKVWVDNNNQDNLRQDIYVQLYKNGEPLGERYLLKLDGSTGWTHVWKNLVKYENGVEVEYTVNEVDAQGNEIVPTGYTKTITFATTPDSSGTETKKFTITNTHESIKTAVSVTKEWDDNDDQDGSRPTSVTVKLYADNEDTGKSVTLNEGNHWTAKWDNLDAYEDGKAIKYSVVEASVPDYTVSYTPAEFAYTKDNTEGAFTVTNTHKPGKTAHTVKKVWKDDSNRDSKRPTSITVQLCANNVAVADGTVILNEANNWSYTWNDLEANNNGTSINYSVVELAGNTAIAEGGSLGEYKVSYTSVAGLTTITNSYISETVDLEVEKVWSDGTYSGEITVALYADGKIVTGEEKVLKADNTWTDKWEKLPKYAAGNPTPIKYTVKELEVPEGWSVSYNSDIVNNKITVTNTKATTQLSVTKVWDDNNNKAGKRPKEIGIQLLKLSDEGTYKPYPVANTPVYLDEVTGWRYTWTNLPDGKYTVEELGTEALLELNYNTKKNGHPEIKPPSKINGIDTIVVTNSYEVTALEVKKTWDDSNNQDGLRPASVKVWLYENDVKTDKSLTLNETNDWKGSFGDLPVYKAGTQVKYAVVEEQAPGYTPGYYPQQYYAQKDKTGSLGITNSYTPGKTGWTVKKLWDDMENKDGIRSPSIDVQLYKNGVAEGSPVTLNEANNWTYTWEQLDAKAEGQDIQYTVDEVSVPEGYEKEVVNDKATGLTTITNTHKPAAPGKLVITKTIEGDITKEEAEGALTFTVTAPDGSKKTYTLKDFTYDEASKKYVLVLDNLTEGSYTVEETTYDVEGRKCSVSYSVDGAPAQAGNQAVTEVKDNTEVTVDFKNVYEGKKTQLIITKRIQGDVTKEEAEGALTFQVKNNATGQTDTYTLKQFTYDPATGLYTLTLDVVPGGYTVTETTKDVDGYQCSVTYSIDGGAPAAGDSASVTVVDGGSVKIAFEDNYTATDTKSVTEEQTTEEQDTEEDTEDEDTEEDTTEDGSDSEHKPKTGDDSSPLAAGAVMILAFGAMAFLYSEKKKH